MDVAAGQQPWLRQGHPVFDQRQLELTAPDQLLARRDGGHVVVAANRRDPGVERGHEAGEQQFHQKRRSNFGVALRAARSDERHIRGLLRESVQKGGTERHLVVAVDEDDRAAGLRVVFVASAVAMPTVTSDTSETNRCGPRSPGTTS